MELVFEDPPRPTATAGRPRVWDDRVEALSQHPGRWVNATKTWGIKSSGSIQKKRMAALGIQVGIRRIDGAINLFVRWVGEEEGEE